MKANWYYADESRERSNVPLRKGPFPHTLWIPAFAGMTSRWVRRAMPLRK